MTDLETRLDRALREGDRLDAEKSAAEVPVNFVPPIRHPSRQAPVATKGPWGRFGALMAHSRVKRHRWINDRCQDCGITRSGYAGGRTGFTCYHDGAGALLGFRAPPCVPVVVHDPQPLRPRTGEEPER